MPAFTAWSRSGATAYATWARVPSGIATRVGRLRMASQIRSAASSGLSAGKLSYILVGAAMVVRTSGMQMVVMRTRSRTTSNPMEREKASKAAFEATYAENRGAPNCTPAVETLTT